jgi:hypothetical protein
MAAMSPIKTESKKTPIIKVNPINVMIKATNKTNNSITTITTITNSTLQVYGNNGFRISIKDLSHNV